MAEDMSLFTDGAMEVLSNATEDQRATAEIRNTIAFGFDVENWLRSGIGLYLDMKSKKEIEAFRSELESCKEEEMREIQLEIVARRLWKDWLIAAVQEGNAAQAVAHERNQL